MGLLDKLLERPAAEKRATKINPKHPGDPVLAAFFGKPGGINITEETAMRVTAVWACVTLIAETMAALPLHVLKRDGSSRSRFTNHPLYKILHDMPWPGLTSFEWREAMLSHTALSGDSFARIWSGRNGQITGLEMLPPARIRVRRGPDGLPVYEYQTLTQGLEILFDAEVLRIPYKMLDGIHSLSPIRTHRLAIGNALQSNQYLDSFMANAAQPKGAITTPNRLDDEAAELARSSWEKRHQGPENAGRIAIFDAGWEWKQIGLSNEDAQYLQLLQFSVHDIARIFLVPPHKIGAMEAATFSNIEHQAIEFVVDTIMHWARRAESRFDMYLLSEADRAAGVHVAFDLKGLLRGDSTARANFYKALFFLGAISPNEIRALEEMNPIEGGDQHFVNAASVPLKRVDDMIDQTLAKKLVAAGKPGNEENDNDD